MNDQAKAEAEKLLRAWFRRKPRADDMGEEEFVSASLEMIELGLMKFKARNGPRGKQMISLFITPLGRAAQAQHLAKH